MKAIANQVTNLRKLATALSELARLVDTGRPSDDDTFGEALLRSDVVNPGRRGLSLETHLAQQRRLPPGRRTHEKTAAGLKRLFGNMGLTVEGGEGLRLTPLARYAVDLQSNALIGDEREFWRMVARQIVVGDEHGVSHPYQLLLKLVDAQPGVARASGALALEARDDSPAELARIVALAALPAEEARQQLGHTSAKWKNAGKVLPSFAEQLGDLVKVGGRLYPAAPADDDLTEADIHSDPDIMGGNPVFRGTRVPVRMIAEMMVAGADAAEMLNGYPSLTRARLDLAVRWAAAHPAEPRTDERVNMPFRRVSQRRYPRRNGDEVDTGEAGA